MCSKRNAQRKVLEARLLKGVQVITLQPDKADRKRLALEAEEYIKRSEQKSRKTYVGYKNAVELFLASCKKTYLDEITRDDKLLDSRKSFGRKTRPSRKS